MKLGNSITITTRSGFYISKPRDYNNVNNVHTRMRKTDSGLVPMVIVDYYFWQCSLYWLVSVTGCCTCWRQNSLSTGFTGWPAHQLACLPLAFFQLAFSSEGLLASGLPISWPVFSCPPFQLAFLLLASTSDRLTPPCFLPVGLPTVACFLLAFPPAGLQTHWPFHQLALSPVRQEDQQDIMWISLDVFICFSHDVKKTRDKMLWLAASPKQQAWRPRPSQDSGIYLEKTVLTLVKVQYILEQWLGRVLQSLLQSTWSSLSTATPHPLFSLHYLRNLYCFLNTSSLSIIWKRKESLQN